LRGEELLAGLRIALLVSVLGGEEERDQVCGLRRCQGRALDACLAHARAHLREVIPHRGAEVEEAGAHLRAAEIGADLSTGAANRVALAAALRGEDVPAREHAPVR